MRTLLSIALVLATAASAAAQPAEAPMPPPPEMSIDGIVAIPVGDFADNVGIGIGALFAYRYPLQQTLNVTGRAGLIYHIPKEVETGFGGGDDLTVIEIPLLAGVEHHFDPSRNGFYAAAELGLVYIRAEVGGVDDSDTELGASLGGGYRAGNINIRGGIYIPSLDDLDESVQLTASVGFQFR